MKKIISLLLVFAMLFSLMAGIGLTSSAIDNRVENAVQIAIAIANDSSHGYSQTNRKGPDYDCSSLVYYAFSSAGFSFSPTWFNTTTMGNALKNAGFTEITNINLSTSGSLQRGDILWKSGHTEIYIGSNQLVGAHSDYGYSQTGDQNGKEISVTSYYYKGYSGSAWTKVYRYTGGTTPDKTPLKKRKKHGRYRPCFLVTETPQAVYSLRRWAGIMKSFALQKMKSGKPDEISIIKIEMKSNPPSALADFITK